MKIKGDICHRRLQSSIVHPRQPLTRISLLQSTNRQWQQSVFCFANIKVPNLANLIPRTVNIAMYTKNSQVEKQTKHFYWILFLNNVQVYSWGWLRELHKKGTNIRQCFSNYDCHSLIWPRSFHSLIPMLTKRFWWLHSHHQFAYFHLLLLIWLLETWTQCKILFLWGPWRRTIIFYIKCRSWGHVRSVDKESNMKLQNDLEENKPKLNCSSTKS